MHVQVSGRVQVLVLAAAALLMGATAPAAPAAPVAQAAPDHGEPAPQRARFHQVIVPGEDRFTPFAQSIHAGDAVQWINTDTDDHTVVSDDFFNNAGHRGVNILLVGTDNNGGHPGTVTLVFPRPGTFVYYCRFHAHLDDDHQPVAPGPKGGIQDADGNHGTPMMGVITVLPRD